MTTIDISEHMVPSDYGNADQWVSADQWHLPTVEDQGELQDEANELYAGAWIELDMTCKYTGRTRFSVFYQGPGGKCRTVFQGPQHAGPIGSLIALPSVIAAQQSTRRPRVLEVKAGDVLVIHGQRMVIVDEDKTRYPALVSEVELGIRAAAQFVRARLAAEIGPNDPPSDVSEEDKVIWRAKMATLAEAYSAIMDLAPVLRETFSVERTK